MSKSQMLRALVNERLAAAAEDIFVLFERTIAEYEEELCHSRDENHRKQQLLDTVLYPSTELKKENVQSRSTSPDPDLDQEILETPQIKEEPEEPEEQSVKEEEEQLPVPVPESSGVCVKTEELLLLQQRQTELREEPEDISSDTEGHTDDNDDCGPLLSYSAAQMETEADGDHYNQVQIINRSSTLSSQNQSVAETTVYIGADGAEKKKKQHLCPFCQKNFTTKQSMQIHIRLHTGEKPFSCPICQRLFTQKQNLEKHKRVHAGEKPYSRKKPRKSLDLHRKIHSNQPYSCSICKKIFVQKKSLDVHVRKHTGERPYACAVCNKHFADPSAHRRHRKMHTGERPHSCDICEKSFARKDNLNAHIHTTHGTGAEN